MLEHWVPRLPQGANTNHLFQALSARSLDMPPLLLIDNAHLLSETELKGVLHLKYAIDQSPESQFGLILCGNNTLESRISSL
ncbi:hypothetical protein, partial [Acidihalobacter prosperus]